MIPQIARLPGNGTGHRRVVRSEMADAAIAVAQNGVRDRAAKVAKTLAVATRIPTF